jgi:DNA-binding Lrp family transcriptional regulator
MNKNVVNYRIKQLERSGVIAGYSAIIDSSKLGYKFYRVYFNLIDSSREKTAELIEHLVKEDGIWWVGEADGICDCMFAIWTKSDKEFNEIWDKINLRFRQYIKDHLVAVVISYNELSKSYLIGGEKGAKATKIEAVGGGEYVEHAEADLQILDLIANNARIPLIEIARRLDLDSSTVRYRLRQLEKKKIIQGYRAILNPDLLGYDFYCVKVNLNDFRKKDDLEAYVKNLPNTTAIIDTVGGYDFDFDMDVKGSAQYHEIIEDIKSKFDFIREIKYFRVLKSCKRIYLPKI